GRRLDRGGRLALDERADQPPAAALGLARDARLRGGVAGDGLAGELVDVGKDRLRQAPLVVGADARRRGGLAAAPPRDTGARAVGGLQRVQRAALAVLAASERPVDAPARRRAGLAE